MADARKFIISVAVLIAGMTAGFVLLAFAYTGPFWKAAAVAIVYAVVVFFVIRYSVRYVKQLKKHQ